MRKPEFEIEFDRSKQYSCYKKLIVRFPDGHIGYIWAEWNDLWDTFEVARVIQEMFDSGTHLQT